MKKLLAMLLLIATCLSLAACGGADKYAYTGEWQVIAYRDLRSNSSLGVRDDSALGDLVVIDERNMSYEFDGGRRSDETYFTEEDKIEVIEWKAYDTTYKKYGPLSPFGESLMIWTGPHGSSVNTVLLRRNEYKESFAPVASLVTGEGQDIVISLDALVGNYSSCLSAVNSGASYYIAFSTKSGANDLTVTKEGDSLKFTEGTKTWTAVDTELNTYLMGVGIKLVSGDEVMYITVLEVSDKGICYALNSIYSGTELMYGPGTVYNYGVLVKK